MMHGQRNFKLCKTCTYMRTCFNYQLNAQFFKLVIETSLQYDARSEKHQIT